jgi:hypothetical protein
MYVGAQDEVGLVVYLRAFPEGAHATRAAARLDQARQIRRAREAAKRAQEEADRLAARQAEQQRRRWFRGALLGWVQILSRVTGWDTPMDDFLRANEELASVWREGGASPTCAGDVCTRFQFTHAADVMARIVIQKELFFGRRKASALTIPWCTYTDPEVAHVGLSAADAETQKAEVQTISVPLSDVDRAVLDDETDGFVRVHHDRGRLLGCTIVAAHAGELIGQAGYAIARGATLNDFSSTVYPYPTQAEALRKAGDAYRRMRLTPRVRSLFERYFRVTRW